MRCKWPASHPPQCAGVSAPAVLPAGHAPCSAWKLHGPCWTPEYESPSAARAHACACARSVLQAFAAGSEGGAQALRTRLSAHLLPSAGSGIPGLPAGRGEGRGNMPSRASAPQVVFGICVQLLHVPGLLLPAMPCCVAWPLPVIVIFLACLPGLLPPVLLASCACVACPLCLHFRPLPLSLPASATCLATPSVPTSPARSVCCASPSCLPNRLWHGKSRCHRPSCTLGWPPRAD